MGLIAVKTIAVAKLNKLQRTAKLKSNATPTRENVSNAFALILFLSHNKKDLQGQNYILDTQ